MKVKLCITFFLLLAFYFISNIYLPNIFWRFAIFNFLVGPTGIKIPSKTTKRLNNHPLRSLSKDRSTSKTHPFEGLQTYSKFEILTTILDNTKLLSLKSNKTISCVIAKELIADYETWTSIGRQFFGPSNKVSWNTFYDIVITENNWD